MTDNPENPRAQLEALRYERDAAVARADALAAELAALQSELATLRARIEELEQQLAAPPPPPVAPLDPGVLPIWGAPAWRDEFDGDLARWNVRTRNDLGLGIDAGIPTKEAVTIENGVLHIRGTWLPNAPVPRTASATGVTVLTHNTGYMDHRNLKAGNYVYEQAYGRWEIRCKTPTGKNTLGALPAFWLRSSRPGEIDIMEAWGYGSAPLGQQSYNVDSACTTIHTDTDGSGTKVIYTHSKLGVPTPVWSDFHTYAFEYTPTYCSVQVDGKEIVRVTPQADGGTKLWDSRYFGAPMHVRLNMHVGPSNQYWGVPDATHKELTVDPLDFQVDYVRIWGLPGGN